MNQWEIWYARFPYEENPAIIKKRPVIILNVDTLECLSLKLTSHEIRDRDEFDTPIKYWQEAGLKKPSVARISKIMKLSNEKFINRKGILHEEDKQLIAMRFMEYIEQQ